MSFYLRETQSFLLLHQSWLFTWRILIFALRINWLSKFPISWTTLVKIYDFLLKIFKFSIFIRNFKLILFSSFANLTYLFEVLNSCFTCITWIKFIRSRLWCNLCIFLLWLHLFKLFHFIRSTLISFHLLNSSILFLHVCPSYGHLWDRRFHVLERTNHIWIIGLLLWHLSYLFSTLRIKTLGAPAIINWDGGRFFDGH